MKPQLNYKNIVIFVAFIIGNIFSVLNIPPINYIKSLKFVQQVKGKFISEKGYVIVSKRDAEIMKILLNTKNTKLLITSYRKGVPLFIDRPYIDTIGDPRLDGLFLIQLPRHYQDKIKIYSEKPFVVYRIISRTTKGLHKSYQKTDISVNVKGIASSQTMVVSKRYSRGQNTLHPGGPNSSSPILISLDGSKLNEYFKILD